MSRPNTPGGPAAAGGARELGRELENISLKLREVTESLRSQRDELEQQRRTAEAEVPGPDAPPSLEPLRNAPLGEPAAELGTRRLHVELAQAREELEHHRAEAEHLRGRVAELEAENRRVCDQYVASLDRAMDIGNLYVALRRLHGGLNRGEILSALQEIVVNLVGSEELAIFERQGDRLVAASSMGVAPEQLRDVPLGSGPIGRAAAEGRILVADAGAADGPGLSACVPLKLGEEVVGAIAIFRLLGQKTGIGEGDRELFEVLATHAALALRSAALEERSVEARRA